MCALDYLFFGGTSWCAYWAYINALIILFFEAPMCALDVFLSLGAYLSMPGMDYLFFGHSSMCLWVILTVPWIILSIWEHLNVCSGCIFIGGHFHVPIGQTLHCPGLILILWGTLMPILAIFMPLMTYFE
jgi:hypothetical protein